MKATIAGLLALQAFLLYVLVCHAPAPFGGAEERLLEISEQIRHGQTDFIVPPLVPGVLAWLTPAGESAVVAGRLMIAAGVVALTFWQMLVAGRLWGPGAAGLWGAVAGLNPWLLRDGARLLEDGWLAGCTGMMVLTLARALWWRGAWWVPGLWLGVLLGASPATPEHLAAPGLALVLVGVWRRARRVDGVLPSSRLILVWVILLVLWVAPWPQPLHGTWLKDPSLSWRSGAPYANYHRLRELLESHGFSDEDQVFYGPGPHLPSAWLWSAGRRASTGHDGSLQLQLARARFWIFDDATRSAHGEAFRLWSEDPDVTIFPGAHRLDGWESAGDRLEVWLNPLAGDAR